jgi:chaperonin GroEL (HSP60 family)
VQIGADIVKRALSYPLKLIAKNAGVNGSIVVEKVRAHFDFRVCFEGATGLASFITRIRTAVRVDVASGSSHLNCLIRPRVRVGSLSVSCVFESSQLWVLC